MTRLIVQKYGGSSLGTPERILEIADRIARSAQNQTRVIVTVSAMGQSTDELLALAGQITPDPPQRELDMLLTAGERVSMALLSMALNKIGCRAISFTGSQSGIVTSMSHSHAIIEEIRADRIKESLGEGKVVIIAGFQGVSRAREVTTLGRGGSDTTAVAMAATLSADRCEIYSDFPGVFTADPRVVSSARRIPEISYDEMLELAVLGAKVLHFRAAEIARRDRVPLYLLSSFQNGEGTVVRKMEPIESPRVASVTCNPKIVWATLTGPADSAWCHETSRRIAESGAQVIMYAHEQISAETRMTVVIDERDLPGLEQAASGASNVVCKTRDDVATISLIGSGFSNNAEIIARVESELASSRITAYRVTTSPFSVTCLIPKSDCEKAVNLLHSTLVSDVA